MPPCRRSERDYLQENDTPRRHRADEAVDRRPDRRHQLLRPCQEHRQPAHVVPSVEPAGSGRKEQGHRLHRLRGPGQR